MIKCILLIFSIYWHIIYEYLKPYLTWKFIISFGLAWMITNGWCYCFIVCGHLLDIQWMHIVGEGYLAFLWLPCTPEKVITIPIAIFFHKILFAKDYKTLHQLNKMKPSSKKKDKKMIKRILNPIVYNMLYA